MSLGDDAPRQSVRPDLGIDELSTNEDRPLDGESVTITIVVKNYADSTPSNSARLLLYEDDLYSEPALDEMVGILMPSQLQSFGYLYNTTGKRGTHHFFAMVVDMNPEEENTTLENNNATLELNVFREGEGFDIIYEGDDIVDTEGVKRYTGFIALYGNSKVTMEPKDAGCDIHIVQASEYEFSILVTDHARLNIIGCKVYSDYPFYITLSENAMLSIWDSELTNATIRSMDVNVSTTLDIRGSTLTTGGIDVGVPSTTIMDSTIEGDFKFTGGTVDITDSEFYIGLNDGASITNTNMSADEISFYCDYWDPPRPIIASGNSNVVLKRLWDIGDEEVDTVYFDAEDTSMIEIWRELEIHVFDTTDLPIIDASIEIFWEDAEDPLNLEDASITNENGNVTFLLLTDIIVAGNDGYKGNYEIKGSFTDDRSVTHTAFITYRMAIHPSLSYNDSHDELDFMFDPIPPKVCPNPYNPKGTLYNGASLGLTGCMQVTTAVTYVNSTITVIQDNDFQAAIYIEGNGQLILKNTTITSNKKMNMYVIGEKAYLRSEVSLEDSSKVEANAVVGVGGNVDMSTVEIFANIRGTYNIFNVGTGSLISGTWLSEASSMTVYDTDIYSPDTVGTSIVRGGSLSIGGGEFYVAHFELNSTFLSAVQDSHLWGNTLAPNDDPELKRWFLPGSSLTLVSDGLCQVTGSDMHYDEFNMYCKGFNAESSSFNRPIIYGPEATSGIITSVVAPEIQVIGDALVKVFFKVSLYVTNALGGPISDAPITITRMGGGTDDSPTPTSTGTDGKTQFILLAEKITAGNDHEWLGNYRVVVEGCQAADPEDFSVGGGQGDQYYHINFPACVPAIEGLHYEDLELNRTEIVPPNNDVTLSGWVKVTYEGGITLAPSDIVDMTIYLPSAGSTITTQTDLDGYFELVFNMENKDLMPDEQFVIVNATYLDPGDASTYKLSETLNISVLPERPTKVMTPTPYPPVAGVVVSLTDKPIYKGKEQIVIGGRAIYDTGTPVAEGSIVLVQILGTAVTATGYTGANGVFTVTIDHNLAPNKQMIYILVTKVTATHPYYTNLKQTGQKDDTLIIEGKETPVEMPWFLIILVIIVIVIIVSVAGVFAFLKFKTWGTMVECGECGAFIAENSTKCPKCGTEFETEVVKCSECEAWIPALATECPKCGVEFKKSEDEETPPEGAPGTGDQAQQQPPPPGQQPPPPPPQPQPPQQPVQKIKRH